MRVLRGADHGVQIGEEALEKLAYMGQNERADECGERHAEHEQHGADYYARYGKTPHGLLVTGIRYAEPDYRKHETHEREEERADKACDGQPVGALGIDGRGIGDANGPGLGSGFRFRFGSGLGLRSGFGFGSGLGSGLGHPFKRGFGAAVGTEHHSVFYLLTAVSAKHIRLTSFDRDISPFIIYRIPQATPPVNVFFCGKAPKPGACAVCPHGVPLIGRGGGSCTVTEGPIAVLRQGFGVINMPGCK